MQNPHRKVPCPGLNPQPSCSETTGLSTEPPCRSCMRSQLFFLCSSCQTLHNAWIDFVFPPELHLLPKEINLLFWAILTRKIHIILLEISLTTQPSCLLPSIASAAKDDSSLFTEPDVLHEVLWASPPEGFVQDLWLYDEEKWKSEHQTEHLTEGKRIRLETHFSQFEKWVLWAPEPWEGFSTSGFISYKHYKHLLYFKIFNFISLTFSILHSFWKNLNNCFCQIFLRFCIQNHWYKWIFKILSKPGKQSSLLINTNSKLFISNI